MALSLFQWGFILDSLADSKRVEREMGLAFLIILLVQYLLSLSLYRKGIICKVVGQEEKRKWTPALLRLRDPPSFSIGF